MAKRQKPEPIEGIGKRYTNEWLVVQVTKTDRNNTPTEGILLVHTPKSEGRVGANAWASCVYPICCGDVVQS